MAADSRMLEILRQLGEATPSPIRLSRLLQSPPQAYFSFLLSEEDRAASVRIFQLLGDSSLNLRFISEHPVPDGRVHIQFCSGSDTQNQVLDFFQAAEVSGATQELCHQDAVVIFSLYPFNGQPDLASRVFTILGQRRIEILGANTATSVFSLIVASSDVEEVVSAFKQVFVWQ